MNSANSDKLLRSLRDLFRYKVNTVPVISFYLRFLYTGIRLWWSRSVIQININLKPWCRATQFVSLLQRNAIHKPVQNNLAITWKVLIQWKIARTSSVVNRKRITMDVTRLPTLSVALLGDVPVKHWWTFEIFKKRNKNEGAFELVAFISWTFVREYASHLSAKTSHSEVYW